jgi:acetoin utilization protein AcuB
MIAQNLINTDIPSLNSSQLISEARKIFLESCICEVPVVDEETLQGLLPLDLLRMKDYPNTPIKDFKDEFKPAQVSVDMHLMNIFKPTAELELSIIPVVDLNNAYQGAFSVTDLMYHFAGLYSFREIGGIFTLQIPYKNYDHSEISRIVEINNTKILSFYTELNQEGSVAFITIKVNTMDLKPLEATFERYNYDIQVHHNSIYQEDVDIKQRYDLLMRYLDL